MPGRAAGNNALPTEKEGFKKKGKNRVPLEKKDGKTLKIRKKRKARPPKSK